MHLFNAYFRFFFSSQGYHIIEYPHMFFESRRNFKISFTQSVFSYLGITFKSDLFNIYVDLCKGCIKIYQNLWKTKKFQPAAGIKWTMGRFIYILDSSNSSSITFWTSKFSSSSRINWTGIWFFDQVGHQTTNVSWK